MTDITDGATGELRLSPAELAVREMLEIPSGLYGSPINPSTIDQMMLDIADLIEHIAQVIVVLYEDRHRAEETYEGRFADLMVMHAGEGAVLARQFAMAKTRDERHQPFDAQRGHDGLRRIRRCERAGDPSRREVRGSR